MNTLLKIIEHRNFLINEKNYDEERLLGVFLYGSQNYNFDTKESDVDTYALYLPTFEEICLNKEWKSKEYKLSNGEHIVLKDIRAYGKEIRKQGINCLEILFTKFYWVNPLYENIWEEYFVKHKEDFARYDEKMAVKAAGYTGLNLLKKETSKGLANAERFYNFIINYLNGMPFNDCIYLNEHLREELLLVKAGKDSDIFGERAKNVETKLNYLIEEVDNLDKNKNMDVDELIDNAIVKILKFSLSEKKKEIKLNDFFNKLTYAEESALKSVVALIKTEGDVSVSTLVKENAISRPVYRNLFDKLKENNVAEVKNKGVKGTYIKFIHSGLRNKIEEGEL